MKLELIVRHDVSHVDLVKDEALQLGVSVRDGSKDESGPVVSRVKPRSVADRSHAVAEGDIILAVDERNVIGYAAKSVRKLLKESGPRVGLKLHYELHEASISRSGVFMKKQLNTKLTKEDGSFGFVLRRKEYRHPYTEEYPVISNIKGPAYRDRLMQEGDRLLKIDDVSLSWLSLSEIASILQTKTEAEFLFEYSTRVVDFRHCAGKRIDIDIDLPHDYLGFGVHSYSSNSHEMLIGKIRIGSVAERCGVFSEGDVILSINDIEAEFLNVSKANSLLRMAMKRRKISFISSGENQPKHTVLLKSCSRYSKEIYTSSESSVEVPWNDFRHVNTPASTITSHSLRGKMNSKRFCYKEQIKAVKTFQDMVNHMTHIKQNLSELTLDAFENKENAHECTAKCTICNQTQHSVKLCASCLSKINAKCAQSMNIIRQLISHFISVTLTKGSLITDDDENRKNVVKYSPAKTVVSKNLIHSLTDTLPKVFGENSELSESFHVLAERIEKADLSCNACKSEIDLASLTTQKLLLLISLNDSNAESRNLIRQLVYCLMDIKLACDEGTNTPDNSSISENSVTESETAIHSQQLHNTSNSPSINCDQSLPETSTAHQREHDLQHIVEEEFIDVDLNESPIDNNTLGNPVDLKDTNLEVNIDKQSVYFRLTDVSSVSDLDESCENELSETLKAEGTSSRGQTSGEHKGTGLKTNVSERRTSSSGQTSREYKDASPETNTLERRTSSRGQTPRKNRDNELNSNILEKCVSSGDHTHLKKDICLKSKISKKSTIVQKSDERSKSNVKLYKDKGLIATPARIWKSLDTFLHSKKSPKVISDSRSNLLAHSSKDSPENAFVNHGLDMPSVSGINHSLLEKKDSYPVSNRESNRSSIKSRTPSFRARTKTHTETMEVKISNDGTGFGFVLGFSSPNSCDSLPIPIITAIKPKSPAHRIGILAKKDRVLAINRQSIVGIPLKVLENLKRKVFSLNHITLTIEFDVVDVVLQIGTFDVTLDKTLKIGLLFEDVKKSSPMIVKGVIKGSSAHRSGQLFPRDRITFLKCVRNEEFDPVTRNYTRDEFVKITVQRDRNECIKQSPVKSELSGLDPLLNSSVFNPESGVNFIIRNTSIHSIEGSNALVLDQEVTLFRDPTSWDFGFLVGENTVTGKAYVTGVKPGGPASCSGVIKKYDRIMEVNGILVGRTEECSVLSLLTKANDKVDLLIRRLYHQELNVESPRPRNQKIPSFM